MASTREDIPDVQSYLGYGIKQQEYSGFDSMTCAAAEGVLKYDSSKSTAAEFRFKPLLFPFGVSRRVRDPARFSASGTTFMPQAFEVYCLRHTIDPNHNDDRNSQ
jgi:hypothetical protein